jgi:hypothetical protein
MAIQSVAIRVAVPVVRFNLTTFSENGVILVNGGFYSLDHAILAG